MNTDSHNATTQRQSCEAWLTPTQAADHAGVSVATIRRAAQSLRLRGVKVNNGRIWRFRQSDVDLWLSAGEFGYVTSGAGERA